MIRVTSLLSIDESDLEKRFIRSPGPGGQNVNKVETAVQLRFNAAHCAALTDPIRHRLKILAGRRMTAEGVVVITANRFRSQERNRQDARERLVELLDQAATPPKHRRPTKPSRAARLNRLEHKKKRGVRKTTRARPDPTLD